MLQTQNLTKRYEDGNLALDSLNLEIKEGEIFFLLPSPMGRFSVSSALMAQAKQLPLTYS